MLLNNDIKSTIYSMTAGLIMSTAAQATAELTNISKYRQSFKYVYSEIKVW